MSKSIKEIEEAIMQLPEGDLEELRTWFAEYNATNWDTQFKRDVKSDKLDTIADSALAEHRAGKSTKL